MLQVDFSYNEKILPNIAGNKYKLKSDTSVHKPGGWRKLRIIDSYTVFNDNIWLYRLYKSERQGVFYNGRQKNRDGRGQWQQNKFT
jgi:hypothetical protein